jgi:glycosyltransferase involved in cell wall biosynthesis
VSTVKRSLGVAVVAACPFPANHGTPASIREMSEALARRGHRVHVVTYPMHQPLSVEGVTVHRVGRFLRSRPIAVGPTFYKPLLDLLMIRSLVRCIRREKLDVIHAHNYEGALIGYAAKRLTGRPLLYNAVCTMEDELPAYGFIRPKALASGLARLLDTYVPRGADQVTVVSKELHVFLAARGVDPRRITVVPAGVYPEMFDDSDPRLVRDRFGLNGAPVVMYTGSLDPLQRVDYLLRAMVAVWEKIPEARLVMNVNIGSEADFARVAAQIRELGIGRRIAMVRSARLEELPAYLAAADVTVSPRPACPGFPVKLLNYMAARKPIVTFEGSAKGLRHLDTAYLAKDHDWGNLAQGIVTLLEDRAMAEAMGERARAAIVGRLDWPSLAERIEEVYHRMLAGAAEPAPSVSRAPHPAGSRRVKAARRSSS